ncbi:DUF2306 domain-containing protein [Aquirhabdus parva]|uniref:DUF2306 domain-containing protein n=1 Tax=Aquirhabdus parva TaxID=2283318 RepID=A0A345P9U7_9GAMM|nr:DUF2306 domain-containing protein [Aquirhabdus parva]AXI04056.1 DUF2306 domain-containing protein [Aquirhabdus parva]
MNLILKRQISTFFWILIALISLLYGPMAIEYFAHFFTPNAPKLWLHVFTWFAGEKHTQGAGSVEVVQHTVYTHSRVSMLFHTVAGGTAILLASLQFYTPFRKKYPHIHRTIGKVFMTIVVISMIGSISFLIATGPKESFNGLPFYLQLWILALGTLTSAILGVIAIIKGQLKMHQAAMIFCFALLLSAPVLRIEWLFIGGLLNVTHQTSNFFSSLIFGYLVVPCAIAATRLTDFRKSSASSRLTFTAVDKGLIGLGILATLAIAAKYRMQIGELTNVTICVIILAVMTLAAYGLAWRASVRAHNEVAIKEWRIHLLAYFISPIVFIVFWQILCQFTTVYEAFEATSFTAPPIAFAIGYLFMAISRYVKRAPLA